GGNAGGGTGAAPVSCSAAGLLRPADRILRRPAHGGSCRITGRLNHRRQPPASGCRDGPRRCYHQRCHVPSTQQLVPGGIRRPAERMEAPMVSSLPPAARWLTVLAALSLPADFASAQVAVGV